MTDRQATPRPRLSDELRETCELIKNVSPHLHAEVEAVMHRAGNASEAAERLSEAAETVVLWINERRDCVACGGDEDHAYDCRFQALWDTLDAYEKAKGGA